jgi:hypothetical protein
LEPSIEGTIRPLSRIDKNAMHWGAGAAKALIQALAGSMAAPVLRAKGMEGPGS